MFLSRAVLSQIKISYKNQLTDALCDVCEKSKGKGRKDEKDGAEKNTGRKDKKDGGKKDRKDKKDGGRTIH